MAAKSKTATELVGELNSLLGIATDKLFGELEALAGRLGVDLNEPLTDAFIKQAKALYGAYVGREALANITAAGFTEALELFKTGRVPKRAKRVGANTA